MKNVSLIKETGATFTQKGLAGFLSERILSYSKCDNPLIIDPACGDGALLTSIGKRLEFEDKEFKLLGYDTNSTYLEAAAQNLRKHVKANFELKNVDFLAEIDISNFQKTIDFENNDISNNNFADIVIANPPYVRTQILGSEKAQLLAKKYNLKGRVDLYYPFLIAMTHSLKKNGIIGVITSNRFLFTKSGNSIRKFLHKNYEVLELIDLGDTKLFDAAVLPAIFIGKKRSNSKNSTAKFTKIYEEFVEPNESYIKYPSIFHILNTKKRGYFSDGSKFYKKSGGIIKFSETKDYNWALLSEDEAQWVKQIESSSFQKVGDTLKVRVGIKTTADKVFISDSWDKLNGHKPEEENLRDLLSQENLKPWQSCEEKQLKVLYPYYSENGAKRLVDIDKFPKTKKYLEANSEILKSRKYVINSGREWYEIWVPQNPALWKFPKLVFPDISSYPRFYFDNSGRVVNGNCYWIVATNSDDENKLLLIQGVSNSKLMTKYHDLVFGNKLYSGRRRYFSQYVKNYPLPKITLPISKKIIQTVKKLNATIAKNEIDQLEVELEKLVAKAFNVPYISKLG